jgi:plasmid maintenance system antidote protein VapI
MARGPEFTPDWASAPGDTITDILDEREISLADFAAQIGQTPDEVMDLLQGRATITLRMARLLRQALGGSIEFWMARDFQYREDTSRIHASDQEWLSELPLSDMINFGWLRPMPHPSEEVAACLRYFGVPTVSAWRQAYADIQDAVAFRTSPSFDSRPAAVAAWLRQGEIEAEAIKCESWAPDSFRQGLLQARSLTREKDPTRFMPALQTLCAAGGVAVAVVRAPNGCRASGATRFLSPGKALLLLSFRFLSDDHFWFTFFHEAGHILLHGRHLFLEDLEPPSSAAEREANEFAERILIPDEFRDALMRLPADARQIIRFARRIGISPGLVVGQLQHRGRIPHRYFNDLKRRFQWED